MGQDMKNSTLSVFVVFCNGSDFVRSCLDPIKVGSKQELPEIILIDNASVDGTADHGAQHYPWIKLIETEENLGLSKANSPAAMEASGD